jgi:hypothetical protein
MFRLRDEKECGLPEATSALQCVFCPDLCCFAFPVRPGACWSKGNRKWLILNEASQATKKVLRVFEN